MVYQKRETKAKGCNYATRQLEMDTSLASLKQKKRNLGL